MSHRVRVGIAGLGSYVPERVLTNHDFERLVDTSDEWIVQRTGIRERRFAAEGQATSDLCVAAARKALEAAQVEAADLDLIIVGTLTPDYLLPSCSCLVQDQLGARKAGAFDVAAACTGFLTALHTAEGFIAAGRARRVLVLGAETLSRFLDMQDRTSCILFGDAAGAAVLMPYEECQQGEVLRTALGSDGSAYEIIHMKGGGSRMPPTHESVERGDHFIRLRGREVYRFAVTKMADLIREAAGDHPQDQIGLIVPHQVNQRIIESAIERLGWSMDKVMINIDRYGNTSAATVPVALDEAWRTGKLVPGKLIILVAFGAGLTWGSTLLRW
jgi:3-oxoacyl-[acyl-carrier-protein] synthase III